jgi:hypothetical protein
MSAVGLGKPQFNSKPAVHTCPDHEAELTARWESWKAEGCPDKPKKQP